MNPVTEYIKDIKVEGVKLQLQLCSPYTELQQNDILGTIDFKTLDVPTAMTMIKAAIIQLEQVSTFDEIFDLLDEWDKARVAIQYQGYYFDPKRKTEAWCYVFFKRILKRNHKDLCKQIYGK